MPIHFTCQCGKEYQLPDDKAGKRAKCGRCGAEFVIPSASASPSPHQANVPPPPVPQPPPPPPPPPPPSAPTPSEDDPFGDLALSEEPPPPSSGLVAAPSMGAPVERSFAGGGLPRARDRDPYDGVDLGQKLRKAILIGVPLALFVGFLWCVTLQISILMWAIGGLLGWVVGKITPERSQRVGLVAAGLTLLSIMFGIVLGVLFLLALTKGLQNVDKLADSKILQDASREKLAKLSIEELRAELPAEPDFPEMAVAVERNAIKSEELKAWILAWENRLDQYARENARRLQEETVENDEIEDETQTPPGELADDWEAAVAEIVATRERINDNEDDLREYVRQYNQAALRHSGAIIKVFAQAGLREGGVTDDSGGLLLSTIFMNISFWQFLWLLCALGTAYRFGAEGAIKS